MRTYKRINDIYEVQLADCKKYFQFVQTDSSLLGGDIIVIYSRKYDKNESPTIEDIVKDTIEYCCHTNVSRGIKEGLWRKYGNGPTYIDLSNIYFRNYINEPCLGIQRWHIWKANEELMCFDKIPEQYAYSYITYLFPVESVYHKIAFGKFIGEDLW